MKYDDERIRFRKQNKKVFCPWRFVHHFLPFCPEEDRKEKKRNLVNLELKSEKFKQDLLFLEITAESRSGSGTQDSIT